MPLWSFKCSHLYNIFHVSNINSLWSTNVSEFGRYYWAWCSTILLACRNVQTRSSSCRSEQLNWTSFSGSVVFSLTTHSASPNFSTSVEVKRHVREANESVKAGPDTPSSSNRCRISEKCSLKAVVRTRIRFESTTPVASWRLSKKSASFNACFAASKKKAQSPTYITLTFESFGCWSDSSLIRLSVI